MYVRIFWGKIRPGMWSEYEEHYNSVIQSVGERMEGFLGRQLLRSAEDSDEGISMTFWDSLEDLERYDKDPERQQLRGAADHLYTGEYWVKHYEVRSSDMVTWRIGQ